MRLAIALDDLRAGAAQHEFWRVFAVDQIASRYRRSRLGQFWITLSVAIFVFVIGGLYRGLFSAEGVYFAHLAVGYIVWLFISEAATKGCTILIANRTFLTNAVMPVSVFCYQLILTELYVFAHHLVILPPIFLYLGLWPGWWALLQALAGFALAVYMAFWVALVLGILTVRFRDLVPMVQSLTRLVFFATPIIWLERDLGPWGDVISALNPARHLIAVVRAPLLGEPVGALAYAVTFGLAAMLTLGALVLLARTRSKLVYWL